MLKNLTYQQIVQIHTNWRYFVTSSLILGLIYFFYNYIKLSLSHFGLIAQWGFYTIIVFAFGILPYLIWLLIKFYKKIYKLKRYDLLASLITPVIIAIGISLNTHLTFCTEFIDKFVKYSIPLSSLVYILFILLLYVFIVRKNLIENNIVPSRKPLFLSDDPNTQQKDELGIKEDAEIFAEQVLNNGHRESIVFGLDAPWGSGKTTYLNYCKNYWNQEDIVCIDFEPLRFDSTKDIFQSFIKELIGSINNSQYTPELSGSMRNYAKYISNWSYSIAGINFKIPISSSAEIEFEKLKKIMSFSKKRIIIIIDDLDRIAIADAKKILDVVKKSFGLPNISYILCYDSENMNAFYRETKITKSSQPENPEISTIDYQTFDNEKIIEYLEKIVNIKKTLIVPRENLKNYMASQLTEDEYAVDDQTREKLQEAIEFIFNPSLYHHYVTYIGDLRKVKRLLNILKLLIPQLAIGSRDIDCIDLMHLLLIYINYPHIFRKIYITETDGSKEFFSLVFKYDRDQGSSYCLSENYKKYHKMLNERESFLLDAIFTRHFKVESDGSKKQYILLGELDEDTKSTTAALNGTLSAPRNLEPYLDLIAKKELTDEKIEYSYHKQRFNDLLQGKSIGDIFAEESYRFSAENDAEKYRSIFFNVIKSNINKLKFSHANEIIDYILDHISDFSVIRGDLLDSELRQSLIFLLARLLDEKGWEDKKGNQRENLPPYIATISQRIFGESPFHGRGIIEKFLQEANVLYLYDLLQFRLTCSADRGNNRYNLETALQWHYKDTALTSGSTQLIAIEEMRELSQCIYEKINSVYIDKKISIIELCNSLTEKELFGLSYDYIELNKKYTSELIEKWRTGIMNFIFYNIANTSTIDRAGIGMGYFDLEGENDKSGIRLHFNEYIFNICFSNEGQYSESKAIYFIRYLLGNLVTEMHDEDSMPKADENYWTRVLDKDMLIAYWKKHNKDIRTAFKNKNGSVITFNYTATYSGYLKNIFALLDSISSTSKNSADVSPSDSAYVPPKQTDKSS